MTKSARITRVTASEARLMEDKTNWEAFKALPTPSDDEPLDEDEEGFDWANAVIVHPVPKELVSIRLDKDVLEHFRAGGKGYQTRINAVLKAYVKAQGGK